MLKRNRFWLLLFLQALMVNGAFAGHVPFRKTAFRWHLVDELSLQALPPIMQVIDKGDVEEVRDIIESNPGTANAVWHGPCGYIATPLGRVRPLSLSLGGSSVGHEYSAASIIKILVEKGANVLAKSNSGNNFLMSEFITPDMINALFRGMKLRIEKEFHLPSHPYETPAEVLSLDGLSHEAKKAFAQEVCELLSATNILGKNALKIAETRVAFTAEGHAERAEVISLLVKAQAFCDSHK